MSIIKYVLKKNENYESEFGELSKFEYVEKKSKFICYVFDLDTKEGANFKLEQIKKVHFNAKHVVYLYYINQDNNEVLKFSDDGEPQGTGTKAILEMIQKENIINICIIIVRYFGGILLGAGPLSRAYLKSFKMAYEPLKKFRYINYIKYRLELNYTKQKDIDHLLENYIKDDLIIIVNKNFGDRVEYNLNIAEEIYSDLIAKIESIK